MSIKGSKKCVLDLVQTNSYISTINTLIKSSNAIVSEYDNWNPKSTHLKNEAELKDFLKYNFAPQLGIDIQNWWLKVKHSKASTPNWDLISTCTLNNEKGILLVEAKAHWNELENESKGKKPKSNASINSTLNHQQIGIAISQANSEINKVISNVSISRDKCYQLSNRVAHSWWLANQGIPVVLMYLGFLNCNDMNNGKNRLFTNDKNWQTCFNIHANQVGVDCIIDKWVDCGKSKFITICKSY